LNRLNWALTLLGVLVLIVTISILLWLRERVSRGLEEGVTAAVRSIDPVVVLRAPTDLRADFSLAENLMAVAKVNPAIRDVVLTKRVVDRLGAEREFPIVPYDLLARSLMTGVSWKQRLEPLRRVDLGVDGETYGYLYFDLDRSAIRSVTWAIGAAALALAAALATLLGRVHLQQSSLRRAVIELEARRRELIRLERLALAGQLSAHLLHDLKKPLLNIRQGVEEAQRTCPEGSTFGPAFKEIEEQVRLFFELVNESQLERFVRSDRVREEFVHVNDVIEQALSLVRYERGSVQVELRLAADLPPALAHPIRLLQVFSNLILNAYQAMGGGGRLTLETRRAADGVEVAVSDSGPGIPDELLPHVFEPFFTTKAEPQGSGLGLAISRLIMEELGGSIEARSRPGGPTTFTLRLPAEASPAPGERAAAPAAKERPERARHGAPVV